MKQTPSSQEQQFERIETMQGELLVIAADIEKRIDVLNQEFQRVATAVRRTDLKRASRDFDAASPIDLLDRVCERLDRIETLLSRRQSGA